MFSVLYDSPESIKAIRARCLELLANGVTYTEWSSEGADFKAIPTGNVKETLLATERFFDELNGHLITQTTPNFRVPTGVIYY